MLTSLAVSKIDKLIRWHKYHNKISIMQQITRLKKLGITDSSASAAKLTNIRDSLKFKIMYR